MNNALISEKGLLQSRLHASYLLGERLGAYKNAKAVIAAIPNGGVPIGFHLAQLLQLPLEIIPCKPIKHPADSEKSIGSVSMWDAFVHEGCRNVPQDYIYRKIRSHQNAMNEKYKFFSNDTSPLQLKGKTVILVDDILRTGDTAVACLKGIRNQQSKKIIMAVPVATPEAALKIAREADEFISIFSEDNTEMLNDFYEDLPKVSDEEVKKLFLKSRKLKERV